MLYGLLLKELDLENKVVFNRYSIEENVLKIVKLESSKEDIAHQELISIKFIMNKYRDLFKSKYNEKSIEIETLKGI